MRALPHLSRSTKVFIGLVFLYLILGFILPANPTTKQIYNLDSGQYYTLLFVVKIPIVLVWSAAFFSYRALHGYIERIQGSPEAENFTAIRNGMMWMAWGLPVTSIVSSLLSGIANVNPDLRSVALILSSYIYLGFSLLAFSYISGGAHRLAVRSQFQLSTKQVRCMVFALVSLGVLFCFLIAAGLDNPEELGNSFNAHYLPNILVWTTIVIPYLYAWFVGIFAAIELTMVAHRSKGIIYRHALQYLAAGLVVVIVSMCMLQYFRSVIPRTGYLTIGGALLTTYGIYALNTVGSVLLAIGARRLKRIEDV